MKITCKERYNNEMASFWVLLEAMNHFLVQIPPPRSRNSKEEEECKEKEKKKGEKKVAEKLPPQEN